ncbi:polysaccharide lyase family 7 protein [Seonamhaeicola algicola]|uniref:Polysaccharide lyase family 7 protein n=1 Tax=Seonamhaeicola algicola TaxID=1719036 RepID=A0A5C7AYJ0_9FLAO|nr:polysaccharide lyase family 7 protein [Seonamhaeicola algicola]TXE13870.1 polysaccharide lyase family 7 protein [Seonamhaeicola algicola]
MRYLKQTYYLTTTTILVLFLTLACSKNDSDTENLNEENPIDIIDQEEATNQDPEPEQEEANYILPNIDLSNWKVTLPIGKPTEVHPPEILNYATNETLKPFFYNDSVNGALVFHTYPSASTANSSYSRTELRELMNPEDRGKTNWTFKDGGNMKGKLQMEAISKDSENKYHRTIIMQIHGRLTDAQRDLIGEDDNNAPPILKIYWNKGYVRVKTKVLKNINATETEMLHTSAWGDDDGFTFKKYVGFEPFELEVNVEEGKMEVILNNNEKIIYNDEHIQKWGIFENYFKAGNYLATKDEGAYATLKYYELEVSH